MADVANDLLLSLVTRLRAYAPLNALVGGAASPRIFSAVPQQQTFPFVKVSVQSQPFAASSFSGQQHRLRVQAHSQSGSMQEALSIRKQVMAALDRQETSLVFTAANLIRCEFSGFADCMIEDDGKTWQSIIEFTILTQ